MIWPVLRSSSFFDQHVGTESSQFFQSRMTVHVLKSPEWCTQLGSVRTCFSDEYCLARVHWGKGGSINSNCVCTVLWAVPLLLTCPRKLIDNLFRGGGVWIHWLFVCSANCTPPSYKPMHDSTLDWGPYEPASLLNTTKSIMPVFLVIDSFRSRIQILDSSSFICCFHSRQRP